MTTPGCEPRTVLKPASLAAVAVNLPGVLRSQGSQAQSPSSRLNVACVGVGGRGYSAVQAMVGENLAASCDVDEERASRAFADYPAVPRSRDFRSMLGNLGNQIDAVTVSTPDHMRLPSATRRSSPKACFLEMSRSAPTGGSSGTLRR